LPPDDLFIAREDVVDDVVGLFAARAAAATRSFKLAMVF
jgi:hypothetical protein